MSSGRSADTASINSSVSSSESDSVMVSNDPQRLALQFTVDQHEVSANSHLTSFRSQTCKCKKGSDWLKRWVEAQHNIFKL